MGKERKKEQFQTEKKWRKKRTNKNRSREIEMENIDQMRKKFMSMTALTNSPYVDSCC